MNTKKNAERAVGIYQVLEELKQSIAAIKNQRVFVVEVKSNSWSGTSILIDPRYAKRVGIKFYNDRRLELEKQLKQLGFSVEGD